MAVQQNFPLPSTVPIMIHDSLPLGGDNVETLQMHPEEMDAAADRLGEELPEKPDLGENHDVTHIV